MRREIQRPPKRIESLSPAHVTKEEACQSVCLGGMMLPVHAPCVQCTQASMFSQRPRTASPFIVRDMRRQGKLMHKKNLRQCVCVCVLVGWVVALGVHMRVGGIIVLLDYPSAAPLKDCSAEPFRVAPIGGERPSGLTTWGSSFSLPVFFLICFVLFAKFLIVLSLYRMCVLRIPCFMLSIICVLRCFRIF